MALSCLHDHYEVLGVSEDATLKEITTAYRKLSLQYHPDKHPDLEAHYQPLFVKDQHVQGSLLRPAPGEQISNAYEVLRDTDKRNEYNRNRQHLKQTSPAAWPSSAKPSTSDQHRDNGSDSKVWEEALSEREAKDLAEEEQRRQAEEELETAKQRWKEEWGYQDKKESDMEAWRAAAHSQPDSQEIWERAETHFEAEPWEAEELSKSTDQWA
ncbi:DnaJ sub C member 10 [Gnomoniopsis sp. IMI 355080]|nr:DnaJ sub C member 10 [Gnomoniopsis sp. IMI 355080]